MIHDTCDGGFLCFAFYILFAFLMVALVWFLCAIAFTIMKDEEGDPWALEDRSGEGETYGTFNVGGQRLNY